MYIKIVHHYGKHHKVLAFLARGSSSKTITRAGRVWPLTGEDRLSGASGNDFCSEGQLHEGLLYKFVQPWS